MRVLVQQNVAGGWMGFDIWFVEDSWNGGKRAVGAFEARENEPAELVFREVVEDAQVTPTLRLSGHAVDDLRRGLDQHGPFTADNLTFVKDTIAVRDRLLTLVERLAAPARTGPDFATQGDET